MDTPTSHPTPYTPTPSAPTLRIATFNAWGLFADWPARLEVLRRHPLMGTFDVVLAQEVCVGEKINQALDLSEAFRLPHHAHYSTKMVRDSREGVAIFSKEPLSTIGRTDLGGGRALIQADLPSGVTVASAHLSFLGRERSEQVAALLKRVSLAKVVLGADFNGALKTFSRALDKYWSAVPDLTPTWPACSEETFRRAWLLGTGTPVTFSLKPTRVDHILTRGVEVVSAGTVPLIVDGVAASDHALVYSEILSLQK